MTNTNCKSYCECHSNISRYMENCDSHTRSLVKPEPGFPTSMTHTLMVTLVYPNCMSFWLLLINQSTSWPQPVKWSWCSVCLQAVISVVWILPTWSQPSSHCLSCPSYWPALLEAITIIAILVGIDSTSDFIASTQHDCCSWNFKLNGLIFYANVVYANKNILLPFQKTSFITVFMSWLNLELGIDTYYFPGMDTYNKTWLQLAFLPIILLLFLLT